MNPLRKAVAGVALVGTTLTGGAIGAALVGAAGAQEDTASTTATQSSAATPDGSAAAPAAPRGSADPTRGGHVGRNGTREELLSGDTAEKVKAAALAAVPGGTVQRVENDAEGSPYEAHMTTADGQQVTVKVDANFDVTSTEDGPR